jgi:uncharacterized protein (TIGR02246 family)
MRKTALIVGVLVAALTAAATAQQMSQSRGEDEKAIRLVVDAFSKAYNSGDAKTIASLFVADGEIVNEEGEIVQGREGIQRTFADIFKAHPKSQIKVSIQSLRFVGPAVAMEDGRSTVVQQPEGQAERSRYTVVHVKQDGVWRMASARDLPDEAAPAEEEVKQLHWLIGEWVDESPDALVATSYRWSDDHRSILSEFKVQVGGRPTMTGTQRIGWDPLAKKIHSWVFDSAGGFAEGVWTRNGNQWIVKMAGVTHDGKPASATNVLTRVAKGRMTWQSRDRVVGGETRPNVEEITIVRKPPQANVTK